MECEFSESSYAFSLISELIKTSRLGKIVDYPLAPSTYEEGTAGYDVKLSRKGKPLFLQFKVPEYITRARKNAKLKWGGAPFYRLKLWDLKTSNQHNILKDLSESYPGSVYYVAPAFHTISELSAFFGKNRISGESAYFSLNNTPKILDNKTHHIIYKHPGFLYHADAYFCSEPIIIPRSDDEGIIAAMKEIEPIRFDEFCDSAFKKIRKILFKNNVSYEFESYSNNSYERLKNVLCFLGVSLMFVTEDRKGDDAHV